MAVAEIICSSIFIIVAGIITGGSGTPGWPPYSERPYCQQVTHGNKYSNGQVKPDIRLLMKHGQAFT
ncbi:hypothetical protein EOY42_24920 [Salmonella enterica]|nr:hypothetical protein [Salmonella enterica]